MGVEIPTEFSLRSIITFILQLLGITWDRIRRLLARHIGEENVALIERAWQIVSTLIEQGPTGIFEMIKEQLNPRTILDQILQAAIDYLIETLIRQVTVRVAMLFNPVGAIAQAIEAIYKVLRWIFDNAARIFSLVETVVNGMAAIIAGDISGMANAVESALARLIAPVIDFIAGLIGLGNLPDRIADTIRGFQEWIEGILDRVIGWLASRARALLERLMAGGEPDQPDDRTPEQKQRDLDLAVTEAYRVYQDPDSDPRLVNRSFRDIMRRYRLKRLEVVNDSETDTEQRSHVVGEINPTLSSPFLVKPLMRHVIITFYHRRWHDVGEYQRQLNGQAAGLRAKTLREWWRTRRSYEVRGAFTGRGRDPASRRFQQSFRAAERERLILKGLPKTNPDKIAGITVLKIDLASKPRKKFRYFW